MYWRTLLGGFIDTMVFDSAEDLQDALRTMDPCDFVSTHLFESIPTVFDNKVDLWIQWKKR
jgi:ABC-type antimicrobial peptide transport system ATPase subunit